MNHKCFFTDFITGKGPELRQKKQFFFTIFIIAGIPMAPSEDPLMGALWWTLLAVGTWASLS